MKLHEYMAKHILNNAGIPVPKGITVKDSREINEHKMNVPIPGYAKAQVLTGGRGKAGGIKRYISREDAEVKVTEILSMKIRDLSVTSILLEEEVKIEDEWYISIMLDRKKKEPLLILSARGGMEIEDVPGEFILKMHIHPFTGLKKFHFHNIRSFLHHNQDGAEFENDIEVVMAQLETIVNNLYKIFIEMDAELVEINPLGITEKHDFIALDAKMVIDSDAMFRHPELTNVEDEMTSLEKQAKEKGIAFVQLNGDVGVIANGAGLTMATMDILMENGIEPGVFLDLGGTDDPEQITTALRLMKRAEPSMILLNIFGGMTRCDTVARGVLNLLEEDGMDIPMVARIRGRNEQMGKEMLKKKGIFAVQTLEEAAQEIARLVHLE